MVAILLVSVCPGSKDESRMNSILLLPLLLVLPLLLLLLLLLLLIMLPDCCFRLESLHQVASHRVMIDDRCASGSQYHND